MDEELYSEGPLDEEDEDSEEQHQWRPSGSPGKGQGRGRPTSAAAAAAAAAAAQARKCPSINELEKTIGDMQVGIATGACVGTTNMGGQQKSRLLA